jgi:hypothetical protein
VDLVVIEMRCAGWEVNLGVRVREEGGLFCAKGDGMIRTKTAPRLSFSGFTWICCLVATGACASAPGGVIGHIDPPEREFTMVGIESELFSAVVRAQLAAGDDDDAYPHSLPRFRYDARPYGTNTGYPEVFAGVEGVDPTLSFARASEREIDRVIESRKEILQANAVREGRLVPYPQCAGAGVPAPPPPARGRSSTRRAKPVDVHAGCPKAPEYYVTVGLPIRGQPAGLKDSRDTRGERVRLRGEVWTILVDETKVGPAGWSRSQYAWLFTRNDEGALELANTIFIGVVE